MNDIDWMNVDQKLVAAIPQLKKAVDDLYARWKPERPGAHIVFGDILNPYLIDQLKLESDQPALKRAFDFLEDLASHSDKRVQEIVQVTVCERLGQYPHIVKTARSYMGPMTIRLANEIEHFWGNESV